MNLRNFPESNLNKLPAKVVKYLADARPKGVEMAKYRLLNGTKNIDKDREKGDEFLFPSAVTINLNGSFIDPETGKDTVEWGVVKSFDEKLKRPTFKKYFVRPTKGDGGIFFIRGNSVADMDDYDGLELSNENRNNPFRDESVPPIFERIDEAKESRVRSKKRNYLFDSLSAIRDWTQDERRIAGAAYNLSTTLSPDELKDRLEEIAEKDPKKFYDGIDSTDNSTKAIIKMSQEAEIITYIPFEHKWVYVGSNETLALLDRREGVNEYQQLLEFLKNSANGPAIKGQLEKLLKAHRAKNKVG